MASLVNKLVTPIKISVTQFNGNVAKLFMCRCQRPFTPFRARAPPGPSLTAKTAIKVMLTDHNLDRKVPKGVQGFRPIVLSVHREYKLVRNWATKLFYEPPTLPIGYEYVSGMTSGGIFYQSVLDKNEERIFG